MSGGPVLAAYDGRARAVMGTAVMLARLLKTNIAAVCAYHHEPSRAGAAPLADPSNRLRLEAAQHAVEHAARHVPPDIAVENRPVPAAELGTALVEVAREIDAAAIVLGPGEHGHVTADVARVASCPVAVAPSDALLVAARPSRIAVACDGTPSGRVAALAAAHLAKLADRPLVVLGVAHRRADAHRLEDDLRDAIADDGLDAELQILVGDACRELRRASEFLDVLVCGSRGRGRLTTAVLGSTSAALAADPLCPLLIVPHALRRDARRPLGVGAPPTSPAEGALIAGSLT